VASIITKNKKRGKERRLFSLFISTSLLIDGTAFIIIKNEKKRILSARFFIYLFTDRWGGFYDS
jgi:hypothetical protein